MKSCKQHRGVALAVFAFMLVIACVSVGLILALTSNGAVESAAAGALRVGVTNRYLLAPALVEMGFRGSEGGSIAAAGGKVVVKEFRSQAELRQAFAKDDVDVIADSQTSLSLLDAKTAGRTRVFLKIGHSYGDIAVVTREGPIPISFFDLRGRTVGVEYGGDDHYLLIWLSDLMFGGLGGEKRIFRNGDLLPGVLDRSPEVAVVLREPRISQVLATARATGEVYGSPGTIKVVLSTANYRPLIHYVLAAKDDVLKNRQSEIKALVDAFYAGEEHNGTFESLLLNLAEQFDTTSADVYSQMKIWFADRVENRASLTGKDQVLGYAFKAALTTWRQLGLIGDAEAEIRFFPDIVAGRGPLGRSLHPQHRPFTFQEIEILRSEVEIHFALDSAEIPARDFARLDEVVKDIQTNCVDYRLEVYGYTDSSGSADYNQKLSQRRAEAVADYLMDKLGLAEADVVARGMGVGGDDALNRKTVIKVFQKAVQY